MNYNSFLREPLNPNFFESIQWVTGPTRIDLRISIANRRFPPINRKIGAYSAAATREGFGFADDMMKSEMRGTISDLKREPLKTP